MQPTPNKGLYIIIVFLSFIALFSVAFNIYQFLKPKASNVQINKPTIKESSLFDSQTASMNGQITKVSGETITVRNQNGAEDQFKVAKNAVITGSNPAILASPLTDLKKIETNKPVYINFVFLDNEYAVSSITVVADLSPQIRQLTTQATGSATPLTPAQDQ